MTPTQLADLRRIAGEEIALTPWQDTVQDVRALLPALADCDMAAAVLPLGKMSELLPLLGGKPLLQAVSKRVPTGHTLTLPDGRREAEFAFVHERWERILRIELETVPL